MKFERTLDGPHYYVRTCYCNSFGPKMQNPEVHFQKRSAYRTSTTGTPRPLSSVGSIGILSSSPISLFRFFSYRKYFLTSRLSCWLFCADIISVRNAYYERLQHEQCSNVTRRIHFVRNSVDENGCFESSDQDYMHARSSVVE
jgi:hypothetical protein